MSKRLQIIAIGALGATLLALVGDIGGPFGILAAYFTALPLFAVGFTAGTRPCLIAVAITAVVVAVVWGGAAPEWFVIVQGLPAVLIVGLALRTRIAPTGDPEWVPPGEMLAWLAAYGAVIFAAWTLVFLSPGAASAEETLAEWLSLERVVEAIAVEADPASVKSMAVAVARFLPAAFVAGWIVMMVVNAVLGFQAARKFGSPQRPEPTWSAMTLPGWLMTATAAAALAALAGRGTTVGFVGGNAALALCVPYVLLGFAVAHTFAAGAKYPWLVLWGVYLVVLLFGWPIFVMAAVGFAEDWVGLRRHIAGPRPEPEDER